MDGQNFRWASRVAMNSFCFPFGLRIFFVGLAQFFVRAVGGKVSNFSTDLGKTAAAFFFLARVVEQAPPRCDRS